MLGGKGSNVWSAWCCGALVLVAPFASGCATIFGYSGPQEVEIESTPADAEFELSTTRGAVVRTGSLPATVKMKTKWNYTLKVSAPGYKEKIVPIDSTFNNWTLCNIMCWPGFLLDGLDGAMFELPEVVHVRLVPGSSGSQRSEPGAPPSAPPGYPAPPTNNDGTVQAPGGQLHVVLTRRNENGELLMRVVPLEPLAEASRL